MIYWNNLGNIQRLYRKPLIEDRYKKYLKKKKDKILEKLSKRNIYYDVKNRFFITVNDFRYDIEDNVLDLIIWIYKDENEINDFLEKIFNKDKYEWILRKNNEENQSIPEINHLHLFIRYKNN